MQPADRITVIDRIATRMDAYDDWAEIDLILEQFGFSTEWRWEGDAESYVVHSLQDGTAAMLGALDHYLMGHSRPDMEPWEGTRFRLFITHATKHKLTAHTLKSSLHFYGIDAFVAHDDTGPRQERKVRIESALHSCDALVGLLHDGFPESHWCDQEVGFALGLGVPVVPVHFDLKPYGFLGAAQAIINAGSLQMKSLARSLTLILLHDKRTASRLTEAMVEQLVNARSFDQANRLSGVLATEAPILTREQGVRLRDAAQVNGELQGAFAFESNLSGIERRILAVHAPAGDDPDEQL